MIRHTAPPSIRLAIEHGKIPPRVKDQLTKVIKAHKKAVTDSDVLYGQLTKAANMEGGDSLPIAGAKRSIVTAVKSSKEWREAGISLELPNATESKEEVYKEIEAEKTKGRKNKKRKQGRGRQGSRSRNDFSIRK